MSSVNVYMIQCVVLAEIVGLTKRSLSDGQKHSQADTGPWAFQGPVRSSRPLADTWHREIHNSTIHMSQRGRVE